MIFAALALAALMASCVKEAETPESTEAGIKMEFTASWAEGEASRTVVAEDGAHIIWSVGEQINVFYGTQFDGVFTSTNTEPAAIVTFQGMLNILTGSLDAESIQRLYWAIYPYNENNTCDGKSVTLSLSCNQIGSSGTFADKFFPAVACGSTPDLAFYNVCGCVRFSVVREGVQKVVFRSNDGSPMAGTVCVGFGDDNKPQVLGISDAEDYIVVNAPEGGFVPGENYFATMLPQDHKEGITVTLYTASKKAIKTIDNPVTFNRSTYKKLDNADEGLEYTDLCEIVDLGLSVKWASCNIGASAPEEYGDWFAWGEVEPKENYSWETYKWCMGSESTLTKYCTDSDYGYNGFTDNKTLLDPEDDAATVNWGDDWRMPTTDEFSELVDECTLEWTTLNGVYGMKFTSNKEGYTNNWIFLPAALSADTSEGLFGDYWTSSLVTYSPYFANYLFFNQFSNYYLNSYYRYGGRSVRPVYQKLVHVTGVSVSPESATVSIGEPLQLTAAITPDNATDMSLNWRSSDESVAKVSADGAVEAIGKGTAEITVTTVDGGYTASCTVSVIFEPSIPEAVDLGLSVKWASFNLGASSPEHNGAYFAWGETEPKAEYSWATYKWCMNGNGGELTKYCTNSTYGYNGFTDNKTVLEPVDDAATVNLGSGWRMPTFDEFSELVNECTWEWISQNGVSGMKFTAENGNSIFIPDAGGEGHYWSSSISTAYTYGACILLFNSDVYLNYYSPRYIRRSVRPVYGEFVHVTGVSISPESTTATIGESIKLTAEIVPANALEKGVIWSSSDESVAAVSFDGVVSAIGEGTAEIIARTVDGGYTASCTVSVDSKPSIPEAVDLGLSVKWASFNLGASKPENYGSYFAWGETEPKAEYSWTTYKWCKGSDFTMTKYCTIPGYGYNGFTDGKTLLEPEDDAATVNLGSGWRLPTFDEFEELKARCTWEWSSLNGVSGMKVTAENGNSIFLPAAGNKYGMDLILLSYGLYWTSSLEMDYSGGVYAESFYSSGEYYWEYDARYFGRSIRPVYGEIVHVTGVSVSPENATTTVGESSLKLTATISPGNAPEQGVTWSSSDESVATVSYAGVVTGIAAGTVVITVTTVDGGYTASCTVTVEKYETVYVFKEDFEDSSTLGGWWSFDADGDGYNWDYKNSSQFKTHSGTGVMSSASWYDGQALTPDNWLFTPAINFTTDNYLSFWTCGQDPNYPQDFYAVYIIDQEPSAEMLGSCEELYHETLPDGDMHQHIIQIPAGYANKKGYIAFRHYNCTDWYRVNLDDVVISEGAPATASSVSVAAAQAPRQRLLSVPFQKDRANQEILNSRRGDVRERRALR